jgi:hypothetical protein
LGTAAEAGGGVGGEFEQVGAGELESVEPVHAGFMAGRGVSSSGGEEEERGVRKYIRFAEVVECLDTFGRGVEDVMIDRLRIGRRIILSVDLSSGT